MKKIVAGFLSLMLTMACATAFAAEKFTPNELCVGELFAGESEARAQELFGEPTLKETVALNGTAYESWTYDGLTLTFSQDALVEARWTTDALTAPRGLKVGDDAQTVKNAFFWDKAQNEAEILYTDGEVNGRQLPPCGVAAMAQDGTFCVVYQAPVEPYDETQLAEPASYLQKRHATLLFRCVNGETVSAIEWTIGTLDE